MKVQVVSGFLGSGKTTLLRRVLAGTPAGERVAVLINELGAVGIDSRILEGKAIRLVELTSGCICCTLKGSLAAAIEEIDVTAAPARLFIETTGVAQPGELLEVLAYPELAGRVTVAPVVTVVDASKFPALRKVLGNFYTEQIRRAQVVVLNKEDLAGPTQMGEVAREVARLNPTARLLRATHGAVDPALLAEGPGPVPEPARPGLGWPTFDAVTLMAEGILDRERLEAFLRELDPAIFRAKGYVQLPEGSFLLQYAAGQWELEPADRPADGRLVFVGTHLDRPALERALANCQVGIGEPR